MTKVTAQTEIKMLQEAHRDAIRKNGPIAYTKRIRTKNNDMSGKYHVKTELLNDLMSNLWEDKKKRGGHRKFTHKITGVTVEFSAHRRNKNTDPGEALSVMEALQDHINILYDDILGYRKGDYRKNINFKKSLERWKALQSKGSIATKS